MICFDVSAAFWKLIGTGVYVNEGDIEYKIVFIVKSVMKKFKNIGKFELFS